MPDVDVVLRNRLLMKDAEEARDAITKKQQREISKLYSDWAKEVGERAEYFKNKTTPSSVLAEQQLRILQNQLVETSRQVSNEVNNKIVSNMYLMADSVVKSNTKWLESLGFTNLDKISASFTSVPDQQVRRLVTGQVYQSGWSLSKAIWSDNEKALKDIYGIVASGLAQNRPIYEIAKNLESYVNPNRKLNWNLVMEDGRRIYKKSVDYNAQRLARTLVQHSYQTSFVAVTKNNPLILSYRWIANGSRVCPLCMDMDGRIFEKDNLPLDHPNGMCTMEPVIDDNYLDRLADWVTNPEGSDPELDEFAKMLGYTPESKVKSDVTKAIVPQIPITGKYADSVPESVKDDLLTYILDSEGESIVNVVDDETVDYIKNHMETTNETMYRVEDAKFTASKIDVGSTFQFSDDLRSFTSSEQSMFDILNESESINPNATYVVFKTTGENKSFSMNEYVGMAHEFASQNEHILNGKFEVLDKYYDDEGTLTILIKQVNDDESFKNWTIGELEKIAKDLPVNQEESEIGQWARSFYIDTNQSNVMNAFAREAAKHDMSPLEWLEANKQNYSQEYYEQMKKAFPSLDKAFSSYTLQEGLETHRFVKSDFLDEVFGSRKMKDIKANIGSVLENNQYLSTTVMGHDSFGNRSVMLTIQAPKGTKCLPTDNIKEGEVVFGRKYDMEFLSANKYSKNNPKEMTTPSGDKNNFTGLELVVRLIEKGKIK